MTTEHLTPASQPRADCGDELTPIMKLKREPIAETYAAEIVEALCAG